MVKSFAGSNFSVDRNFNLDESADMEKLTEYLKANRGKAIRLAEHLGLRPSTISQWKSVPVEHLAEVESFTGIPRQQLLPEAFREAKGAIA